MLHFQPAVYFPNGGISTSRFVIIGRPFILRFHHMRGQKANSTILQLQWRSRRGPGSIQVRVTDFKRSVSQQKALWTHCLILLILSTKCGLLIVAFIQRASISSSMFSVANYAILTNDFLAFKNFQSALELQKKDF